MIKSTSTFFFLLFMLLSGEALQAQCDSTQHEFKLEIDADFYFEECSWTITGNDGSVTYASGAASSSDLESFTYCVPKNECLRFNITDTYGDGINPGSYTLFLDGVTFFTNSTGAYGSGESIPFNCPIGTSCIDPYIMELGTKTATIPESWHAFYPSQTGVYKISTCHPENTCRTKIWVYDQCNSILITDDNLGTIFYADSGCDSSDLATATLYLAENTLYFIRIGSDKTDCVNDSIVYTVSYEGAISGCMDSLACNFEPLASLPDTCYYTGSEDCSDGPDLVVSEPRLKEFFRLATETNNDACEVFEGCTNGYGTRHKIKFSTFIANTGTKDYYIGEVPNDINQPDPNGQFVYDPCHGHWHYRGYAEYLLADEDGNILPIGSKNGFCVLDLSCSTGSFKYTCQNMGISVGCEDEYDWNLPCQWIDITGVEAGRYTMICRVNWDQSPDKLGELELDYDNNWAQVCFNLSYTGNIPDIEILNDCPQVVDCEGVVRGDAKRDCNGDCNGIALKGDLNQDTARTDTDLQQYLSHTIANDGTASDCTDLYADGAISLYDAALLNECILHNGENEYWASSFACLFPTGQKNPNDKHIYRLSNLNPAERTFNIDLSNNNRGLYGVDLTIDGIVIESVEEIHNNFDDVTILIENTNGGRIVALSTTEKAAPRSSTFKSLFKVKYASLTNDTICLKEVRESVNDIYELATPILASSVCLTSSELVNNQEVAYPEFQVHAFPNPVQEKTTLVYPEVEGERVAFSLYNSVGQIVRSWTVHNNQREEVYRKGLPAGVYQLEVRGENGKGTVRLVFE